MSIFGSLFGQQTVEGITPVGNPSGQPVTVEFAEMAIELINETIEEPNVVWVSTSKNNVADPNLPFEVGKPNETNYNVKVLFFPDDLEDRQFKKYRKETSLTVGQINGIMHPYSGFTPTLKDTVLWEGRILKIKAIDSIQPIDKVIIYLIEFGA